MNNNGVGLYQGWNTDLRQRYLQPLDEIIKILRKIPRFPFIITDLDVNDLLTALTALRKVDEGVMDEINESIWQLTGVDNGFDIQSLYNPHIFSIVRGSVLGIAIKKVEKGELKPGNPVEEVIDNIPQEWKDLNWDPKNLKKKLIGDEDGEE